MRVTKCSPGDRRSGWGFTLIELIVVVIILAVLATVAAVAYNQFADDARVASAVLSADQSATALQARAMADDSTVAVLLDGATDVPTLMQGLGVQFDGTYGYTAPAAGADGELRLTPAGSEGHAGCILIPADGSAPTATPCGTEGGGASGGSGGVVVDASTIAGGNQHTCALDTDQKAWCWGYNGYGNLGNGNTDVKYGPVAVAGSHTFTTITAGDYHTCALDTTGKAWCWGYNKYGQLGNTTHSGTNSPNSTPLAVDSTRTFATIAGGNRHTCALDTTGKAWCWGYNRYGELGNSTNNTNPNSTPVQVTGSQTFTTITVGGIHTCALDTTGKAWCWGFNDYGELGNSTNIGTNSPNSTPLAVGGSHTFTTVTAGGTHTCALDTSGKAWCWGRNYFGELGNGTNFGSTNPNSLPRPVTGTSTFATITAGAAHTCAVDTSGKAWCWGSGGNGRLGTGNTTNQKSPVGVGGTVPSWLQP